MENIKSQQLQRHHLELTKIFSSLVTYEWICKDQYFSHVTIIGRKYKKFNCDYANRLQWGLALFSWKKYKL